MFRRLTLIELLRGRAQYQSEKTAYTFLRHESIANSLLTYSQLDTRARAIAAYLQAHGGAGERVMLFFPPGLEFVEAFFGCLYAGAVAVPVYALRPGRTLARLEGIAENAQASIALATAKAPFNPKDSEDLAGLPWLQRLHWAEVESISDDWASAWADPEINAQTLAYLQYTSGSTSSPKGVMMSHANLFHNAGYVTNSFHYTPDSIAMFWLPHFHDLGLVAGIIHPLYEGLPSYLMSPAAFLQTPFRWLDAISRLRVTHSAAPNFAFDYCVRRITAEQRATLDLSSWQVAINGAEPLRAASLDAFSKTFGPQGFRESTFYPAYGLAEATLVVSGVRKAGSTSARQRLSASALQQNRIAAANNESDEQVLISCGSFDDDTSVVIVDPKTGCRCGVDEVGEIWVANASVALGYWNRPAETEQTFQARLAGDRRQRPFLRTGDLGFIRDGELYIGGRLKDLIIIRGLNHYPQDIEQTMEESHPSLRAGCGAAFSIVIAGEERLVLVQEIERKKNADAGAALTAIRQAVSQHHDIQVHAVVLIKHGTFPKTSSGKIQRHACRVGFLDKTLDVIADWQEPLATEDDLLPETESLAGHDLQSVLNWLSGQVARHLRIDAAALDLQQPLGRYGLDSLAAIELAHSLETNLGTSLPMVRFLQDLTATQLAEQIVAELQSGAMVAARIDAPSGEEREFPLSYGQRALWFLHQLDPDSSAYNIAVAMKIDGEIDTHALRRAFQRLVDRHPILRTTFTAEAGHEPLQVVHDGIEVSFNVTSVADNDVKETLVAEAWRPFNLVDGPLMRVNLFRQSDRTHILLLVIHHIAADFWSLGVLMDELGLLYKAEKHHDVVDLPSPTLRYSDYVRWQHRMLQSHEGDRLAEYWIRQLSGELPLLNLPEDFPRPPAQTYSGASVAFRLSSPLVAAMSELGRGHGATLYMTLVAAFQVLLARYAGQDEVVIGSPASGRSHAGLNGVLGYFVNPLCLRADLSTNPTFAEFLGAVRQTVLSALEHQDYPFALLVERLQPERDPSRSPLFQVMLVLEKTHRAENAELAAFALGDEGARIDLDGLVLESVSLDQRIAQFDLTLMLAEDKAGLTGSLQYNTRLFRQETIERMATSFCCLLESIVRDPGRRVKQLRLLSEEEKRQQLIEWNATAAAYPRDTTMHELFAQQAARTPEAIAVVCGAERLSYGELERRSNQLARYLRRLGVGAEERVGICVERSLAMVVGLLGILKAGGAYVPLDPAYPAERLQYMLADAGVKVLLTQPHLHSVLSVAEGTTVVNLSGRFGENADQAGHSKAAELPQVAAQQLAYIIYTSGSTGAPKGVAITHENAVAMLSWGQRTFSAAELAGVLAGTSICFDLSVFELFLPLSRGGKVIVAEHALSLAEIGKREAVTLVNTVPSAMTELVRLGAVPATVQTVNLAGEALARRLVDQLYGLETVAKVYNLYGPSETTTYSTWSLVGRGSEAPTIGRPINNTQVYVLNEGLEPVPLRGIGELYIGGAGVARGYLQRPGLTAERFVPDPFSGVAGARLYRTGDLARYRSDGALEFLGRADNQLKLRGYRIELGEIEAALEAEPQVKQAAVVADDFDSDRQLVAYIVPAQTGDTFSTAKLRERLLQKLPKHMVPAVFEPLQELPLNPNGKIDRRRLPAPEWSPQRTREYEPPASPNERLVADVWMQLLRATQVGVHDNFFDLGGHSLLATQVISRINEALKVNLPVRSLFATPTLAGFAQGIEAALREQVQQIEPIRASGAHDVPRSLSYAQQRLWFLDRLEHEKTVYNMTGLVRLVGPLNLEALERSVNEIVRRHEILRTVFVEMGDDPVQVVAPSLVLSIPLIDLQREPRSRREELLQRLAVDEARRPFDLSRGPLLRIQVARLDEAEHALLLNMHHIISDGWSIAILVRELNELYAAFTEDKSPALHDLPIQYADFAEWQRRRMERGELDAEINYWKQQLAGAPAVLQLPTEQGRPAVPTQCGGRVAVRLPAALTRGLKQLSREHSATLFMTLLAGFAAVLGRYTNEREVMLGTPVAGRPRVETEPLIGFFVNTLVVRVDLSGGPTFAELLQRVREVWLGAYEHQEVPFERLVEELQVERSLSHTPLFQVLFGLNNVGRERLELGAVSGELEEVDGGTTKFDLTLLVEEAGEEIRGVLSYRVDLFEAGSMERLVGHYERLLAGAVADAEQRVSELRLLSEEEQRQQLIEWNATATAYPRDTTMHELFAQQAARTPEAIAVVCGAARLSYGELEQRSNQLARYLRRLGVRAEERVGICVERSLAMVVGLLGILKAGGAYVPLDPAYPAERLKYMLADAGVKVLLTQPHLHPVLSVAEGTTVVNLSDRFGESADQAGHSQAAALPQVAAQQLAYIIYTSGSTGAPKGVAITHENAVAMLSWGQRTFSAAELAGVLAGTSICFDLSVFELFLPLSRGGKVIVAEHALSLAEIGKREAVTLVNTVPSAMTELVRLGAVPASVQTVNLAGEALARRLVDQLYGLETVAKVYNLYGPSETTTYSTWSLVGRGREAPTIGGPINNTQVYVLNEGLELVPLRGIGELYIGGAGVARGYLQRPGLTAERFVPDPFSGVAGARLYRTGDLARYRSDGALEFLGRADNQLKLRGYRIELGEIEAALEAEPQVKQAAVVVHEGQYGPQLVAYVAGESNRNPDTKQLRVHLKLRLPEYMVPAAFVVLETMPLNPNGKIDRRTLRTLKPELSQSAGAEPLTATEEWIASLWANVLNVEQVGPEANFFDLGGHSLLATRLLARVRETSGVELNLRQLFEEPTVRQMAQQIESELRVGTAVPESAIERLPRKGGEPTRLSFAQQRLWFLEQLEQAGPAYNMAFAWRLKGTLNLEVLEAALTEITRRHEVFRSTFKLVNERPAQITHAAERFRVTTIDLRGSDDATARAQQEAERPFDLQRGPLLRATVLRLAGNDAVLLVAMHHICFDGWSIGVLSKELSTLYSAYLNNEAPDLPELQIQYADFAQWQRDWFKGPVLSEQVGYWKERLSGAPEFLELPTDRPRPRTESFNGAWYCSSLPQELVRRVHDFSRRESASLFMTLLATFQTLLSRYTHQDDIVIGTPIANRTRTETEDLIGFFVNTLLVRTDLSGGPTFRELLKQVRDRALEAYAHQDLPFEKLVEELQPARSLSYTPLFQVLFVLQNVPLPQLKLPGLEAEEFEFERKTSKLDLSLYVVEKSGTLNCYFEYNTDLFDAATIERMAVHFRTLLSAIIADPDRSIVTLPLLDEEQQQQIAEWNATTVDFPTVCVTQLFEEQARKSPDTVALECAGTALTYDDLNSAANRLARYLQKREVGTETLVGIFMDRSPEMVVAILAVLKAGAAYLPLDTGYPRERLSLMLEDAEPLIVLTQENLVQQLPQCNAEILAVDRDQDLLARESGSNPSIPLSTANLAYVIYTSGSTGKPKGVQITHRALMNFLSSMQKCPGLTAADVMLSVTTLSFDIAGLEIYLPLITGARVVLVTREVATDGRLLIEELNSSRATVMQATPSTWRLLLEAGWQDDRELKLLCGGEALRRDLSEQLLQRGASVWNLYGPTETTIWSTLCRVEKGDPFVHVGRPIANTQVFILDEQMQLVPPLVSGELYIGGEGLARGYLKRPELTATQFVPNPFSRNAGERLYKTGDRARYLSDGNVEILGRTDHQVKLRGYRIELGEIEEALSQHPLVSRSVAVATEPTPGDHRLIAYFVSDSAAQLAGKTELEAEHVSQWETIWNKTYSRSSADDSHEATLNLKGWISSYTGQPVPAEQMREWVDNTVERILSLAPKRVLDVGCGTGLLLFRVAPQCSEYTGVDLSENALEYVGQQLQQPATKLPQVTLQKCAADEVVTVIKEPVDTVILNSVVQYFPSVDYLIDVLSQTAKKVRPGGAIFIGDVRSLPLLESFHASVQLHQCPDSLSRRELAQRVRRHMDQEEELIIDPALFTSLTDKLPQISSVEVHAKRSRFQNELTRFRYDVILHVGDRAGTSNGDRPAVVDWGLEGFSTTLLRQFLKDYRPDDLFLTNVPNARVVADVVARALIADPSGPATAGEIRAALDKVRRDEAVDPEELWKLGEELGYRVEIGYAGLDTSGSFRVRFAHVENTSMPALPVSTNRAHKVQHSLANDPLRGKLYNALVPELKNHLRVRLPEHMMPDTFVMLDELPLTPNGKVDRRALPEPLSAFTHGRKYTPEHLTERESVLKSIWEKLLNLSPIRLEDNFFELGGHSLLATRLLARVRDAFGVELMLRQLFEGPKLRQMAAQVEALAAQSSARDRIERKAREEGKPFELSYAQQRLWFIEQLTQGSPFYNVGGMVRLKGELDVSALERSFDETVRRHEVLRTTFQNSAGRPVAVISPPGRMRLIAHDLSARDFEQDAEAQNLVQAEANHVFDLAAGPLIRLTLIKLRATEHILLLNMHHIISDAWSLSIFMRELSALYRAFTRNQPSPLPELPIQYGDYASWQLSNGERFDEELSYWKQQLAGAPAVLQLPTEQGRPAVPTQRGGRVAVRLAAALSSGLKQLSREHSATLFMTLLAGFAAVLGRYTNEREVMLGTPVAGRSRVETEPLIGFFVNTLVVRVDLSGGPTFAELLQRVRETWLGAYEHQEVPFERLVEELQVERSLSHTPLFQVLFGLNNVGRERLELGGVKGELEEVDEGTTKFDLTLLVEEAGEEIRGVLSYRVDLFEAGSMERLVGHYERLLAGAVADAEQRVTELRLLSEAEQRQQLIEWNATAAAYPRDTTMHELFAQQAARTPEAIAVVCGAERLSYGELEQRSNQLARYLRRLGVGAEERVGICVERSLAMVVGLLGILKAGGAYVPLDPAYPVERLQYMLADAGVKVLLTQRRLRASLPETNAAVVCLDGDWEEHEPESGAAVEVKLEPENLAYVIYTSGSTGRPKGVLITHGAVTNHLSWRQQAYPLGPSDRFLQKASLSFDISVWEIFAPLLAGAQLVLAAPGGERDSAYLVRTIAAQQITQVHFGPALLQVVLQESGVAEWGRLQHVFCGGEPLSRELQAEFQERVPARLHHQYGPTETTIDVCIWDCGGAAEGERMPIGRPIANTELYILDERQGLVPVGVSGELYVGGVSLARGYLHGAGLTAERFVPHPFSAVGGARLYRTGDLARYRASGEIEFLGRLDQQLKIRGYRVEPSEIETVLRDHSSVLDCVVLVPEEEAAKARLVAYVLPAPQQKPSAKELREYLSTRLPGYMIPAAFVLLEAFPLNHEGKIDRAALPAPQMSPELAGTFVPCQTPMQKAVAGIWSEMLGLSRVSLHDNFFEIGGHSLLATQVAWKINEAFRINLSLRGFFEATTISQQSELIESMLTQNVPAREAIVPLGREQYRTTVTSRRSINLTEAYRKQ